MKYAGLWAIGIGVLIGAGLLPMGRACAGEDDHPTRCTLATLNGQYLFNGTGTLFPPAFGVTSASALDFISSMETGLGQTLWPSPSMAPSWFLHRLPQ
jgi:hypothetical protein